MDMLMIYIRNFLHLFDINEPVWVSVWVIFLLFLSTLIGSLILFRDIDELLPIAKVIELYFKDDIMPTPYSILRECKELLRDAAKEEKIHAIKIKNKWHVSRKEAFRYLDEHGKNPKIVT